MSRKGIHSCGKSQTNNVFKFVYLCYKFKSKIVKPFFLPIINKSTITLILIEILDFMVNFILNNPLPYSIFKNFRLMALSEASVSK